MVIFCGDGYLIKGAGGIEVERGDGVKGSGENLGGGLAINDLFEEVCRI